MKIMISPAKKMNLDTDSFLPQTLPKFLEQTTKLKDALCKMCYVELKSLWNCNDAIAELNYNRLQKMDLMHNLAPAVLAYDGIQYQYMAPSIFEDGQFAYIEEHLRILSGFYGILNPFDGVTPYRLEMQARLPVSPHKDLYAFWGDKLAKELALQTDFILNLASKEYSKAVTLHISKSVLVLTCTFGELIHNRVIEKGTLCKMARGEMVRYLAEQHITEPNGIKSFNRLGYCYSKEYSSKDHYVFIKMPIDHL